MALDDKDKKILSELLQHSDKSQKSISGNIGITESELTKRKNSLFENGTIKNYTINIDYNKIGYSTTGYFIFAEKDKSTAKIDELIEFLFKIPEIVEIHQVFGKDMDVILKIMCADNARFFEIIGRISNHENVTSGGFTAIVGQSDKDDRQSLILNHTKIPTPKDPTPS